MYETMKEYTFKEKSKAASLMRYHNFLQDSK